MKCVVEIFFSKTHILSYCKVFTLLAFSKIIIIITILIIIYKEKKEMEIYEYNID
jgi:hypothetical protein